jgi:hypothetical protein
MGERDVPVWVAALADAAVLVLFVAIGRRSHHEDAGMAGFVRVLWPFAAGLVIGWIGSGLYRAPMAFRRAVVAWIITVFVGVALASLFIGGCMLGWRAVVVRVSRRRARRALS